MFSGTYLHESCVVNDTPLPCGDVPSGASQTRIRYLTISPAPGRACAAEEQTRTCTNGFFDDWGGTYAAESCSEQAIDQCEDAPPETRVRYQTHEVPFGQTCIAEEQSRRCANGAFGLWTGTFVHVSCIQLPAESCDGLPHGTEQTRARYREEHAGSTEACESETQTRSCGDGQWTDWSGTFTAISCGPDGPPSCGQVAQGTAESRIRYAESEVPFGAECVAESQTRVCTTGGFGPWTGTYTAEACRAREPRDCDGLAHGATGYRWRYASARVNFDQLCELEVQSRTCNDGTLSAFSGTFTETGCEVNPPASCGDTAHGASQRGTFYRDASVAYGDECVPVSSYRSCWNGTFGPWSSGMFVHESCTVAAPADCGSVAHGQAENRVVFESSTVAFGASCVSEEQSRICNNGGFNAWSGSYRAPSCVVLPDPCVDEDGDGHGRDCAAGPDCDDRSAACHDECKSFLVDADGDGYGAANQTRVACIATPGLVSSDKVDCAEGDPAHWLDCGACVDWDGDAYGDRCDLGADCNEGSRWVHPGATEVDWNGVDDDCDGASRDLQRRGSIDGYAHSALMLDSALIVGSGHSLRFYPRQGLDREPLSSLYLGGPATQLQMHEGLLFAAVAGSGLVRLDVSDPAHPFVVDRFSQSWMRSWQGAGFVIHDGVLTMCQVHSSAVGITRATIAAEGLRPLGRWAWQSGGSYGGTHCDVSLEEGEARVATDYGTVSFYLANDGGVERMSDGYDTMRWPLVSDGQTLFGRQLRSWSPREVLVRFAVPSTSTIESGVYWNNYPLGTAAVHGGRIFFGTYTSNITRCFTNLPVQDRLPYDRGAAPCFTLNGEAQDMSGLGNELLVAHGQGATRLSFDTSSGAMTKLDSVTYLSDPFQVIARPPYLFVADRNAGLSIYETSSAGALPRLISRTAVPALMGFTLAGDTVYLSHNERNGFAIVSLDVSVPAGPVELARTSISTWASAPNRPMHLHQDTLYVGRASDLYAFDIRDPKVLARLPDSESFGWVHDFASYGDDLLALVSGNKLQRLDVSVPEAPMMLAELDVQGENLEVSGDVAVVDNTLIDLTSMSVIARDPEATGVHQVTLVGTRAYVTNVNGTRVVDFSDQSDVRYAYLYDIDFTAADLAVTPDALYLVGKNQGLTMYENPSVVHP